MRYTVSSLPVSGLGELCQVSIGQRFRSVPPAVAAERVLKILGDARTTEEREPIGAIVSVDVELAGLRDRPVLLRWSMWHTGDGARLHGDWLNSHLAYQLQATTDRDTTTVDLWIPLPAAAGPYFVRVDLETEGARLASGDSQPFD
jgi:hypothetical protein